MSQVCRGSSCVNAVHDVGWDTALSGSYPLSTGILYLLRLPELSHDANILAFGAYGNSASAANVELAVYSDNGSGSAPSGASPIATISGPIGLSNSLGAPMTLPPFNSNVTMNASTWYWLGIIVQSSTTIYSQPDSNEVGVGITPASYGTWPAGSGGLNKSGVDLAIFVQVQDLN
jgi:hypothetical protein